MRTGGAARPAALAARRRRRGGTLLLLAALFAVALGMRLTGLLERGIWLDETVSLEVAAHPPAEIARGEVFDNHTPPLYYLLLHLWFRVVPEGLATLRLLSVLLDLAVLGLLWWTLDRHLGRRPALAVGAAYAIAPFAVRLAQEGRMYPLLVLLVVACYALALQLDRRRNRRWPAVALVPVAAAALYTHYYAALSLLALHGAMAWRLRRDRRAARRWWTAMAAAGLLFVPWLPVVSELLAGGGQAFRTFGASVVPYAFLRFAIGFSLLPTTVEGKADLGRAVLEALPLLAVVALGFGVVVGLGASRAWGAGPAERRGSAAGPLAVVLLAVPPVLALAVGAVVPSLDERYLAVCFPFFLVLAVSGLGLGPAPGTRPGANPEAGPGGGPGGGPEPGEGSLAGPGAARGGGMGPGPGPEPVLGSRSEPGSEAGKGSRTGPGPAGAGGTGRGPEGGSGAAGAPVVPGGGGGRPSGDRGRWVRRLVWWVRGLAVGIFLVGAAAHPVDPDAGTMPWRELAAELERRQPEGGVAVVRPGYYADVLRRNLGDGGWRVLDRLPCADPRAGGGTGSAAAPGWLVEVAFLVRDRPLADPGWRTREVRLLPAGNGLRLSRLSPREARVSGSPSSRRAGPGQGVAAEAPGPGPRSAGGRR